MTNLVSVIAFFLFVLKLCNELFLLLHCINSVIPTYQITQTAYLPRPFLLECPHRYSPLKNTSSSHADILSLYKVTATKLLTVGVCCRCEDWIVGFDASARLAA